ncbi:class I adenylate-forming enzyme family protein [Salinisphaera aquimarina]|uniref:Class I adenylate-forming enzyme family protein n=1 Tax=Salinisphaera aquimarina TaxID=2094031 RepID=A0ABV7EWW3_9GAMM
MTRQTQIVDPADSPDPFASFPARLQRTARAQPDHTAIVYGRRRIAWAAFHARVRLIAGRLQAAGIGADDKVAMLAHNCPEYLELFAATLHAGACAVPLSSMATGAALEAMLRDSDARVLLVSAKGRDALGTHIDNVDAIAPAHRLALDFEAPGWRAFEDWVAESPGEIEPAAVTPDRHFNLIYSSGTTGTPKGILHDHRMRARQLYRLAAYGYDDTAITLVSTPLYSNTTLVSALPALNGGGTLVLMPKFDERGFLELAERERVTHAMLVPVQYQRLLAHPDFDDFDLSSFRLKSSTSAPLRRSVMEDAMKRWPGRLVEVYGLTEGGVSTMLDANAFPDKLDTVGRPAEGVELNILDEQGRECAAGETGEIVGRATAMMAGYYNRPDLTEQMIWHDAHGAMFFKTGDLGRLDADGFLTILDRKKDMIISGGFNIYASDLEAVLLQHPGVADAAVIGIPSERWGETPLGLVVRRANDNTAPAVICEWANTQLGHSQRLAGVELRDELPRSSIGKILKRELREPYLDEAGAD